MTDADPEPGVGVVVVAAGSGSRLGAGVPKAFVAIGGERIVDRAVRGALAVRAVSQVVVVVPAAYVQGEAGDLAAVHPEPGPVARVTVVAGGAERTDSVRAGLAALDAACAIVLVHDAARCLTPAGVYDRVIAAVRAGDEAVVPGLPVVDTMKVVDADGLVLLTPERARVRAIQTPQGFTRAALDRAHASGQLATDDAALAEACGIPVRVVLGDPLALKVTTPEDLAYAERLLEGAR
ncbi:MAG: 2-C-methyl-D-erythritol 4-phosphate cytidylyltransferase [Tetrasphaera sp.]|nr:2-C-methyl-D-erythritol 4-phosphate cytidylyltransferase [Tetrasphaera sp.]